MGIADVRGNCVTNEIFLPNQQVNLNMRVPLKRGFNSLVNGKSTEIAE